MTKPIMHSGPFTPIKICVIFGVLLSIFSGVITVVQAQDGNFGPLPPSNTLAEQSVWNGPDNQFVTSTIEDSSGWWWGTDNDGLWHFSPDAKQGRRWQHFRAEDGLYDDSVTSLCIDKIGRLWVGTERRGVTVYNNSWWQNYDIMSGPLGVHVTSIVNNPINGDVWISSEGGLSIYSETNKKWRYINTSNGLAANDINCLAFTSSGKVFVGTADDGLLLSSPSSNYTTWTHITANPAAEATETGAGLCSEQINCLLINKAGKIFCGTSSGLSFSTDKGATWTYLHGWMWQTKVRRHVASTYPVDQSSPVLPLSDDYISALAFDSNGDLYMGHRQGGVEAIYDSDGSQLYHTKLHVYGTDIRSLTTLAHGGLLIGNYGEGASVITWTTQKILPETKLIESSGILPFPTPAPPLTNQQVEQLIASLKAKPRPPSATTATPAQTPKSTAYFLGEDWQTQGSWVGRYGRELAILCAADAPADYVLGDQTQFVVDSSIGIALNGTSVPSSWLQWEQSGDPRVLYDPEIRARREAEWVDQGERDDQLGEGPDLWLTVTVPNGLHRLALYFVNNDGHTRTTRFRDYIIQLMPAVAGVDYQQTYDNPSVMPVSAETRVENFWPGVYENFVINGPSTYYVKIDRNYSLNTILQGVFIDGLGSSRFFQEPLWMTGYDHIAAKPGTKTVKPPIVESIEQSWALLDSLYGDPSAGAFQRSDRIELLRAAIASKVPLTEIDQARQQLGLWSDQDWSKFNISVNRIRVPGISKTTSQ